MSADEAHRPRFAPESAFHRDLKARVDAWFAAAGRSPRDQGRMYLKSAIILAWFVTSWVLLVFLAPGALTGIPLVVSLGLAVSAIGMGIQHDASHGGYSDRKAVNRVFTLMMDVIGASSYVWRTKHNVIHHTYTNVQGSDDDLEVGFIGRLSPHQARRPWHRFQHLYLWLLYGFLLPKWVFYDDFANVLAGRIGPHRLPRPRRKETALLLLGKAFFLSWALVVPMLFHPVWVVLVFHLMGAFTVGITLAITFQLAHCVEEAEMIVPAGGRLQDDWAAHQLRTTVDFAPTNPIVTWFAGGLNFQVEHHLFPRVCHVHYPAIARIVTEVAAEHGLQRRATPTLRRALRSHYRVLRRMGRAELPA